MLNLIYIYLKQWQKHWNRRLYKFIQKDHEINLYTCKEIKNIIEEMVDLTQRSLQIIVFVWKFSVGDTGPWRHFRSLGQRSRWNACRTHSRRQVTWWADIGTHIRTTVPWHIATPFNLIYLGVWVPVESNQRLTQIYTCRFLDCGSALVG